MTSWRDARPDGHDELVAICLGKIDEIIKQCGGAPLKTKPSVTVEKPCGGGFIDLCLTWEGVPNRPEPIVQWGIKVYPSIIVEVKSQREAWNAGDVIRQLKRYKKDLKICWPAATQPDDIDEIERIAGHRMAIFAGRRCTDIERTLFAHEGVTILDL